MPNTNQILFIAIISILFSLAIIGIYVLMNKASNRRRELFDLEQRLQEQERQLSLQKKEIDMYQPAMIKQGHQIIQQTKAAAPLVIMTPQKKLPKRESLLEKIYGSRNISSPPFLPSSVPQRPSTIRPPSFLPMQENYNPPVYGDYCTSTPILLSDSKH
ncbi:uncharacterized protein ATC70_001238 [Mucor velutinosus]|uniref:Uncharacterized protein n=1 Tax=Mucor velutinosus TaxID=708070 RepID=A0AAN7DND8_9FUNG|nr:hypothetical protein ATC70_001238 [Mucor velutinosus]